MLYSQNKPNDGVQTALYRRPNYQSTFRIESPPVANGMSQRYQRQQQNVSYTDHNSSSSPPYHQQQRQQGGSQSALGFRFQGTMGRTPYQSDMPLRMVMNTKYVGALIGQAGSNIRQICRDSKAKCVIDITRSIREGSGNLVEKAVNIYGSPEHCSAACCKVLEIILREARNDPANQGKIIDPELKLLAHNNLIGRLIGKQGATIKKIMEDTSCVIFISNYNELGRFNIERTITVRGATLQNVCIAESMISSKLRITFESDMKNPQTRAMYGFGFNTFAPTGPFMFGGSAAGPLTQPVGYGSPYQANAYHHVQSSLGHNGYPPALLPTGQHGSPTLAPGASSRYTAPPQHIPRHLPLNNDTSSPPTSTSYARNGAGDGATPLLNGTPTDWFSQQGTKLGGVGPNRNVEISYVWVPGLAVGPLIGTQGSNIRKIMRSSGARIHIDSPKPGTAQTAAVMGNGRSNGNADINNSSEQQATTNDTVVLKRVAVANKVAAPGNKQTERRVIVMGTEIQQYKSQFWIFHRLCEDHYMYFDSMRLCIDIPVPSSVVGRIIGKKGRNIQELQRFTGAQVRLVGQTTEDDKQADHVFIRIVGNFNAAQVVQTRVRQLVRSSQVEDARHRQENSAGYQGAAKETKLEAPGTTLTENSNIAAKTTPMTTVTTTPFIQQQPQNEQFSRQNGPLSMSVTKTD